MDPKVILVILIVAVLVIGVNGAMILFFRNWKGSDTMRLWRQVGRRARNPWEKEDKDLEELSKRVEQFKNRDQ